MAWRHVVAKKVTAHDPKANDARTVIAHDPKASGVLMGNVLDPKAVNSLGDEASAASVGRAAK